MPTYLQQNADALTLLAEAAPRARRRCSRGALSSGASCQRHRAGVPKTRWASRCWTEPTLPRKRPRDSAV